MDRPSAIGDPEGVTLKGCVAVCCGVTSDGDGRRTVSGVKGGSMIVEGTLSIVCVGNHFGVRFASTNPHTIERQMFAWTDTDHLDTLLRRCGVDGWSISQARAELQHGRCAVLFLVVSAAQVEACFGEVGEQGMTKPQEQDACEARQVRRTAPRRVSQPDTRFGVRR